MLYEMFMLCSIVLQVVVVHHVHANLKLWLRDSYTAHRDLPLCSSGAPCDRSSTASPDRTRRRSCKRDFGTLPADVRFL